MSQIASLPGSRGTWASLIVSMALLASSRVRAEEPHAEVAVIVDTSISMKEVGMDRERTSLLVAKLLADLVPGQLAVVRLPDVSLDAKLLPAQPTGREAPCDEDPTLTCKEYSWGPTHVDDVRAKQVGVLSRPARGDTGYKQRLDGHLQQITNGSHFYLTFQAARGYFDSLGAGAAGTRTVVWLSDGRATDPDAVKRVIAALQGDGVRVEAVVFGRGDTQLATEAGLAPTQVSSPPQLMKAFANMFRKIVGAPYEIDGRVASAPTFQIKPRVDEAWVVIYGDASLSGAWIEGPSGRVQADYATDSLKSAGAYRVAHMMTPAAGSWTVGVTGGGPEVAYAVVQRSALAPALIEPQKAVAGAETLLVAAIRAGSGGAIVTEKDVLASLRLEARLDGQSIQLFDDGSHGDKAAGDGYYSAKARFEKVGPARVEVSARGEILDRTVEATVDVAGIFQYDGGPVAIDFGEMGVSAESCRGFAPPVKHEGAVPLVLSALRSLPAGASLELRTPVGRLQSGGAPLAIPPGSTWELCLISSADAASSEGGGARWAELRVSGSSEVRHAVPLELKWTIHGLTFWQRWGWLIRLILAIMAILFFIAGWIVPSRFPRQFSVALAQERAELEDISPRPIKEWPGVGIGFYRDARAYLLPSYRFTGKKSGAIACLHATGQGVRVLPYGGNTLYREMEDGDWKDVGAAGRVARGGDVYRVGDSGPYWRVSLARRGRNQ